MVCLGFKPQTAGWKAQTNPLSYGVPMYSFSNDYALSPSLLLSLTVLPLRSYSIFNYLRLISSVSNDQNVKVSEQSFFQHKYPYSLSCDCNVTFVLRHLFKWNKT